MGVKTVKTYDLDEVYLTLGPMGDIASFRVQGYSSDGAIEVEVSEDLVSMSHGNDGLTAVSRTKNYNMNITLSISELASVYPRLFQMAKYQTEQREIPACPFFLKDKINGDQLEARYTIFKNFPGPSKEVEAGAREFNLALPNGRHNLDLGSNLRNIQTA